MLRQVRRTEVQFVNWRVDQPLDLVLRQALGRRPAAPRINRINTR
jgi:hypothetical protein